MAEDLEIIQEIERILGIKLKQVAYADILKKNEVIEYILESEFIHNEELPRILRAAEDKGTKLLILIINTGAFRLIDKLSKYQTLNPPNRLLSDLTAKEQDEYFVQVVEEVLKAQEAQIQ